MSIHGKLYFILVIYVGINLLIAAMTSDFKLTHMSLTDVFLLPDESNQSLQRAKRLRRLHICSFVEKSLSRGSLNPFRLNVILNIEPCRSGNPFNHVHR